jgi:L-cysteine S-thiosulfotransferase
MNHTRITLAAATFIVAGCATTPSPADYDRLTQQVMKASFREQGIAKLDRIQQDQGQAACSSDKPPPEALAKQIEAAAMASVKWPEGGRYLGDWRIGETLAQNGRGMTWTDAAGAPSGGNCYNCHQISKAEISYGTIGPSLYNYGKLRGVADPANPSAKPIVEYTWAKLYNAKAYNACSGMPRFGHAKMLDEAQLKHLMALLLDPKSPVNQ